MTWRVSGSARERRGDHGVSPVIGMVLVLLISVATTAGVVKWGLPAIEEMKAQVERRSMETQFKQLDADVKELVSGSAGKTAKRWQPSLDRGRLSLELAKTDFVILVNHQATAGHSSRVPAEPNPYNLTLWSYEISAGDSHVILKNKGAAIDATLYATAWKINGSSQEQIRVSNPAVAANSCAYSATDVETQRDFLTAGSWTTEQRKFCFWERTGTGPDPININAAANSGSVLRLDLWKGAPDQAGSKLFAQLWITQLGGYHYVLNTSSTGHDLWHLAGGVLSASGAAPTFITEPPFPPPRAATAPTGSTELPIYRFFARTVSIVPAVGYTTPSYAGQGRFNVINTLYGTASLAQLDCDAADLGTCAKDIRIYANGPLSAPFYSYFLNAANGHRFKDSGAAPVITENGYRFLYEWEARGMAVSLVHSTIEVRG